VKASTYDKIFDNMWSGCWALAAFVGILVVWTAVFSGVVHLYDDMTWSLLTWVSGAAFTPAFFNALILVLYRISCNRFGNIQFRDIWMAWATVIKYNIHDGNYEKCAAWIEKNINGLHRVHKSGSGYTFIFKQKTDAMAFKLTWEEEMSKNNAR